MAFKIFLSYSIDADEQAIMWRLQTLAASHGMEVFVPQRPGISLPSSKRPLLLQNQARAAIDQSDVILAIITVRTEATVEKELNYALGRNKLIVPLVEASVRDHSLLSKLDPIFRFSRFDPPGHLENRVIEFLKMKKLGKERQQALGALVAIGLGLLLLSSVAKE